MKDTITVTNHKHISAEKLKEQIKQYVRQGGVITLYPPIKIKHNLNLIDWVGRDGYDHMRGY